MLNSKCTKFLSILLVFFMVLSSNLVFADATNDRLESTSDVSNNHTKESITNELYNLGFTDKEVEDLFEEFPYDENQPLLELHDIKNNEIKFDSINNTSVTLANRPGQQKNRSYKISTNFVKGLGYSVNVGKAGLALSKAAWAKIIVKKVGWKITVLIGAISAAVAGMFMGPNGVKINVTYRWTYGDNSMAWFWAPIKYSAYKY